MPAGVRKEDRTLPPGTLLFHKRENKSVWPVRVLSWNLFDGTDPAQCCVPDGSRGTTNFFNVPEEIKLKEYLLVYLGSGSCDFTTESKDSERLIPWDDLSVDLKDWMYGSKTLPGLRAKYYGTGYFPIGMEIPERQKDFTAALGDAFAYEEKRRDRDWFFNDYGKKRYGYVNGWERLKKLKGRLQASVENVEKFAAAAQAQAKAEAVEKDKGKAPEVVVVSSDDDEKTVSDQEVDEKMLPPILLEQQENGNGNGNGSAVREDAKPRGAQNGGSGLVASQNPRPRPLATRIQYPHIRPKPAPVHAPVLPPGHVLPGRVLPSGRGLGPRTYSINPATSYPPPPQLVGNVMERTNDPFLMHMEKRGMLAMVTQNQASTSAVPEVADFLRKFPHLKVTPPRIREMERRALLLRQARQPVPPTGVSGGNLQGLQGLAQQDNRDQVALLVHRNSLTGGNQSLQPAAASRPPPPPQPWPDQNKPAPTPSWPSPEAERCIWDKVTSRVLERHLPKQAPGQAEEDFRELDKAPLVSFIEESTTADVSEALKYVPQKRGRKKGSTNKAKKAYTSKPPCYLNQGYNGCPRCRHSSGGCSSCNWDKREAYERRKAARTGQTVAPASAPALTTNIDASKAVANAASMPASLEATENKASDKTDLHEKTTAQATAVPSDPRYALSSHSSPGCGEFRSKRLTYFAFASSLSFTPISLMLSKASNEPMLRWQAKT